MQVEILQGRGTFVDILVDCFIILYGYWDVSTEGLLYLGLNRLPPPKWRRARIQYLRSRLAEFQDDKAVQRRLLSVLPLNRPFKLPLSKLQVQLKIT
uniref:Uncharacterized protein n=1 Tax=viral metagenome TaxID=1070528 RepID=A0A6C0BQQ7_9ZZZZ